MHGDLKLANLMVVGIMEKTSKREKKGMGMGVGMGGGKYSSEERNGTGKCGSHDEVFCLFFFVFFLFCLCFVGIGSEFGRLFRWSVDVFMFMFMGWDGNLKLYTIYIRHRYPSLRSKRGAFSLDQSDGTLSKHGD